MDINDLLKGKAAEQQYSEHPVGEFHGQVTDVKQRMLPSGQAVFDVMLRTTHGTTKFSIFDITPQDVYDAEGNQERVQKIVDKGIRTKQIFVDLKAAPPEVVASWGWASTLDRNGEPGMMDNLALLIGKHCWVKVAARNNDPSKRMIFINAPRDTPSQGHPPQANQQRPPAQHATQAIPQYSQHHQLAPQPGLPPFQPRSQPGAVAPDFDKIPF